MDTMTKSTTATGAMTRAAKTEQYRQIIKRLISEIAAIPNCDKHVETLCALDDERHQYLLLNIGWHGDERQRAIYLYLRIRDGKIWIEHDMIEDGITPALLEAGVPKDDIVLAFHPPELRKYTEFAKT